MFSPLWSRQHLQDSSEWHLCLCWEMQKSPGHCHQWKAVLFPPSHPHVWCGMLSLRKPWPFSRSDPASQSCARVQPVGLISEKCRGRWELGLFYPAFLPMGNEDDSLGHDVRIYQSLGRRGRSKGQQWLWGWDVPGGLLELHTCSRSRKFGFAEPCPNPRCCCCSLIHTRMWCRSAVF